MKDPQSLISILIAIGYMLIQFILTVNKKEEPIPPKQRDWETADHQGHFPLPGPPSQTLPTPIPSTEIAIPSLQRPLTPVHTPIHRQLIVTPPYPGIKKLVLPAQEQNPYKLYQAASPQQTHQLNRLLQ